MWMVMVLTVGITVAVIRGGSVVHLADIHLARGYLLVLAIGLQVGAAYVPETSREWGLALILLSYLPLLAVTIANRASPGMWMATVGIMMNFTVIALNAGMPVLGEAAEVASGFTNPDLSALGYKHVALDPSTRLPFLADVIPFRIFGIGQVLSLGDVLLALGFGQYLESELRRPVNWHQRRRRKVTI